LPGKKTQLGKDYLNIEINQQMEDFLMIRLSNGHAFEYMVASGALAFDGKGWPWEKPLLWLGLIKPELFTVVIKSLTRNPRSGNLRWWEPWTCVRLISGGSVNKVGLTNPGIEWWCRNVGPALDFQKFPIVGSIFGEERELVEMAEMLNHFDLVGLEVNVSCPNTGHVMEIAEIVVNSVKAVERASRHPIIVKVSVDQDYLTILRGLVGVAEAVSLNSVPWKTVFTNGEHTPLWRLEKKVGGGGGGVSGKPAQKYNWKAVEALAKQGLIPVIAPSIMEYGDMNRVRKLGAKAVSFGAIHLPDHTVWLKPWTIFTNPRKPTRIVRKEMKCQQTEL
jgi:dihydroorotate dehydrogenase